METNHYDKCTTVSILEKPNEKLINKDEGRVRAYCRGSQRIERLMESRAVLYLNKTWWHIYTSGPVW